MQRFKDSLSQANTQDSYLIKSKDPDSHEDYQNGEDSQEEQFDVK